MTDLATQFFDKRLLRVSFVAIFFSFIFFSQNSFAQAPGMLEFAGRTVKDNNALSGATVTVFRAGTIQQEQVKTGKNGKFRFYLVFGTDYKITFSYPGCVDMHLMVYTSQLPRDRGDLFPLYQADIPFFQTDNTTIRIAKYKNPFTKIIYDGKKSFKDDEAYLAAFVKDIFIDAAELAKIYAEKEAKAKAEKDKLEAEARAKREAELKAQKEAEEKLLAEQKAKEDALKASELARLKEDAKKVEPEKQTMETEGIHLQREKQNKVLLAKKNKEIKTTYENDLLKLVAETERTAKQKAFKEEMKEARGNTVIEQMRRESDLKAKSDILRAESKTKKKKELENKQYKLNEMRKLVEAAAFAERSVLINNQKTLPDANNYKPKELPNVSVSVDDGFVKTTRTTVITLNKKLDTYKKVSYFWGKIYCYKNNIEIDEATYNVEIAYFLSFKN